MSFQLCRYIKTNGLQCRSPQVKGLPYCYFHNRIENSHRPFRYISGTRVLPLGPMEDPEAVQIAISTIVNALASDLVETRRATALLYGLQLASMNTVRLKGAPSCKQIVRETDPKDSKLAPEGLISNQDEDDEGRELFYEDDDEDKNE
ncbi:MAG: hypothetical protein JSS87_02375 [Acidobacteria bacterium]|nr:hypothetical protein [Acidobacteriota bacterium]